MTNRFTVAAAIAAGALTMLVTLPAAGTHTDGTTVLDLQLNERAGRTVANDASGMDHDGAIGSHLVMNGRYADWDRHSPGEHIYYGDRHLIVVPDAADDSLDPGAGNFSVEMRFRTRENFGNIMQKGQAQTPGGQVKFQIPGGRLTCMFRTPQGVATAGSGTQRLLNDNAWHTVRCDRTPESVTMYVDGVRTGRSNHFTGTLNNTKAWTLGGKFDCDTGSRSDGADSCDYFAGEIDYVTMTKG